MSEQWELCSRLFFSFFGIFSGFSILLTANNLGLFTITGFVDRILVIVEHLLVVQVLLLHLHEGQVGQEPDDTLLELLDFSLCLGVTHFFKFHPEVLLYV